MSDKNIFSSPDAPRIYAYTEKQYANRPWEGSRPGKGLLKVGETKRDVKTRIAEQYPTLRPDEYPYTVLLDEEAIVDDGSFFGDKLLHKELEKRGVNRVRGEWFECTVDEVLSVISEIKSGIHRELGVASDFGMRPEQAAAVELTERYFIENKSSESNKALHYLWNAKMRFGKTFTAYQLAKKMGWKNILVLTYKPAVEDSWRQDLKHADFPEWQFLGRGEQFESIDESKPLVWFASFQDILGRQKSGAIKERFEAAHLIDWDCVILDEYHFGAWRDAAKDLYDSDPSEQRAAKNAEVEFEEDTFPLKVGHFLYLSGTPFRALGTGEFMEDQIFNWTYSDEQRAKAEWQDSESNPYEELPQMVMMTYQMPDEIREIALSTDQNEFDLNEFFRATQFKEDGEEINFFEHEAEVQKWVSLIRGQYLPARTKTSVEVKRPPLPFEDARLLPYLNHTFWFLPSVAACKAMKELLSRKENNFFNEYEILVAAGNEAGMGADAIKPIVKAMGDGISTKSITLSCGKLTTGVSVKPWTGIFMLRNTTSPESYFQAAFRVQTPWFIRNIDGQDPNSKSIIKHKCYIFDFAPNRALNLVSEYSTRLNSTDSTPVEKKVEEFLNFLPVLCYDGFSMHELEAGELLDIVTSGTASSMLAKRWQSAHMVNIDNTTLERLMGDSAVMAELEKIEAFRGLSTQITRAIASEKSLNKLKKKDRDDELDPKEKEQLSEFEKERNGFKKKLREDLLKFITRVPIFMYLTDDREECLKDVITDLEPGLFTRVTGLKVETFEKLHEIGVFNAQVMNPSIFAFKRFEEGSLTYAGGKELSDHVGGYDSTVTREEAASLQEKMKN